MPESWDSYSGQLMLKFYKKVCIKGYEDGVDSDLSEEERQIAESFCDCGNEELQLMYPSHRDMPNPPDQSQKEALQAAAEKCADDIMGSDE